MDIRREGVGKIAEKLLVGEKGKGDDEGGKEIEGVLERDEE